jgi:hypothetical protein
VHGLLVPGEYRDMIDSFRRRVTVNALRLPVLALLARPMGAFAKPKQVGEGAMRVVCHIRYEIDPYKRELLSNTRGLGSR